MWDLTIDFFETKKKSIKTKVVVTKILLISLHLGLSMVRTYFIVGNIKTNSKVIKFELTYIFYPIFILAVYYKQNNVSLIYLHIGDPQLL